VIQTNLDCDTIIPAETLGIIDENKLDFSISHYLERLIGNCAHLNEKDCPNL